MPNDLAVHLPPTLNHRTSEKKRATITNKNLGKKQTKGGQVEPLVRLRFPEFDTKN